jgi:hypothetical protein
LQPDCVMLLTAFNFRQFSYNDVDFFAHATYFFNSLFTHASMSESSHVSE